MQLCSFVRLYALAAVICLLSCLRGAAWSLSSNPDAKEPLRDPTLLADPAALLPMVSHPVPEVHQRARDFVRKLSVAPSCARQAAYGLITDCAAFVGHPDDAQGLDHVKSSYAAKLAICELREAGVAVPPECDAKFLEAAGNGFFRSKADPRVALARCVRVIESRPQWWTSYSNNRQNALLICQASRAEFERDKMLSLFGDLAANNQRSEDALKSWLAFTAEQLAEKQALAAELKEFLEAMSREMHDAPAKLADTFAETERQVGSLQHDLVRIFSVLAQGAEESTHAITSALQDGKAKIDEILFGVAAQTRDAVVRQQADLEATSLLTVQLQAGLAMVHDQQQALQHQSQRLYRQTQEIAEQQLIQAKAIRNHSDAALQTISSLERALAGIVDAYESLSAYAQFFTSFGTRVRAGLATNAVIVVNILMSCFALFGDLRRYSLKTRIALATAWLVIVDRIVSCWPWVTGLIQEPVLPLHYLLACTTLVFVVPVLLWQTRLYLKGRSMHPKKRSKLSSRPMPSSQPVSALRFCYYDPSTEGFLHDAA